MMLRVMLILPKCVFGHKNEWSGALSNYPLTPNVVLLSPLQHHHSQNHHCHSHMPLNISILMIITIMTTTTMMSLMIKTMMMMMRRRKICDVWSLAWHLLIDMSPLTGGPTIIITITMMMTIIMTIIINNDDDDD